MSLTTSQYNSIMRIYEERQTKNRHTREERLRYVYTHVTGYQELDESVASVSVAQGKKMLSGDENALEELKQKLHDLAKERTRLLLSSGLPVDYLNPVYDCPECKDTGYVGGKKCHCFRQAEISLLYEQSNLSDILEKENFSTLSYSYYEGNDLAFFQNAVEKCRKFINNFNSDYQNIFFYGTVGTGKTFLSNCVARECIERGHSVIYFSASNLFDTLSRNVFHFGNQDEFADLCSDLYTCDLLIIDDLGTEQTTAFTLSQLFTCLNERLLRKKSVIISTNLSLEEFQNRYQDRIFSRITSNFEFCKLTGPDIRMYKKKLVGRK